MQDAIIHFENFTFQYTSQQQPTLRNIDLSIYPGEKICIVGPSGCGKSTLVQCINGLIPERYEGNFSGSLTFYNKQATQIPLVERAKFIGTVMQDTDSQFIGLTVGEDIAFALENEAIDVQTMREQVRSAAAQVGMEAHLQKEIFELSGGQKQRTAMAGVLVHEIDVLLFDEPLANLDPATGEQAMQLIEALHQETNKTVIIVEHRLEDVLTQPVDRIILMDQGCIVADMTPAQLLQTNLLATHDIREPLYIRLLKYVGIDVKGIEPVEQLAAIDFTKWEAAIKNWMQSIPYAMRTRQIAKPNVELHNISFTYPGKKAPTIKNIELAFHPGEFVSIVGTNGAGKSTLAKCMCGYEKIKFGGIYVEGKQVNKHSLKNRAEYIGYVLQNPNHMFSQHTVIDEVRFGLKQRHLTAEETEKRVQDVLKVCGLYAMRNWPLHVLSYGQKRRVAIASILVLQPKMLILDEPTAGQDYRHAKELLDFLTWLTTQGMTVVVITHDMHVMAEYTNRAIVVHDGEVIADAKPSIILTDEALIEKANLKQSSLYVAAKQLKYIEPARLVEAFIQHERSELHGK